MCSHVNRHMCVGEYRQRLISRVFFDQSYPLFTDAVRALAEPISSAVLAGTLPWEFALYFPSVGTAGKPSLLAAFTWALGIWTPALVCGVMRIGLSPVGKTLCVTKGGGG